MNPFDTTHEAFVQSYRLSQDLVGSLIDLIRPFMERTASPVSVPVERRVLCALSFFATGSYQCIIGKSNDIDIAQPTVSKFVAEVVEAMNQPEVAGHLIQFPRTREQMRAVVQRNRALGGRLPHVGGYVDGTLIKIMKPSIAENRQAFIGRKSFASINVQVACDKRLYVTNVLARFPGATNDSLIWSMRALRRKMMELYTDEEPFALLGDSGYPLEPWLLTPFARDERPLEDGPEARYNVDFCWERSNVECSIGKIKMRFRCLNDERVLHYKPMKACQIVVACTALHNMCVLADIPILNGHDAQYVNNNVHGEDFDGELFDEDVNVLVRGTHARERVVAYLERHRQ